MECTMSFPMYVMVMSDFLQLDIMRPHQELKAKGRLRVWDPNMGPVNFCSHQWLSFHHPDPTGAQLKCMQAAVRSMMDGKHPFRSETDWELYSNRFDYVAAARTSKTQRTSVNVSRHLSTHVTLNDFMDSVRNCCVWLDYAAVPQLRSPAEQKNLNLHLMQQAAINSIPAYIEATTNLWVMAPPVEHADLKTQCNFLTWQSRGWCRVEDWSNELRTHAQRPLIVEGPGDCWVQDVTEKLTVGSMRQHSVMNGEFTCCKLKHRDGEGNVFPCDKQKLANVMEVGVPQTQERLCQLRVVSKSETLLVSTSRQIRPSQLSKRRHAE